MSIHKTFRIYDENIPVKNCTVSHEVFSSNGNIVVHFSLDDGTDISPEIYYDHKLIVMSAGRISLGSHTLHELEAMILPINIPAGMKAESESVFTEINFHEGGLKMNEAVKVGEVLKLSELVPYQDGRIINMDVMSNDTMKFALMSFAPGTGLSEHAAPGDALIFALDGEGIIGYEGEEHKIKAGENFRFARNGKHYVKAEGNFKMALLLMLK